jgi:uncharacterized integral membrane protein
MSDKRPVTSKLRFALAGLLLVIILILVVQNQEPVSTDILLWSVEAPRFALLAFVFLAGIVTGYVLGRSTRIDLGR